MCQNRNEVVTHGKRDKMADPWVSPELPVEELPMDELPVDALPILGTMEEKDSPASP